MSKRTQKYTIEEVKKFAIEKGGECLSDYYTHNKESLPWKCNKCGHIWNNCFKSIKLDNQWCPSCSGRLNNNLDVVRKLAKERGGECLSTTYKNNKTNLSWKCGECDYIWEARLDRVKSGTWCPNCRRSHGEREISKFLDKHNIIYKQEYNIKLRNMRIDFYLPDSKTAIEFDGIQHFQVYRKYTPDLDTLKLRQQFDVDKTIFCLENGIKLIRIHYETLNNIEQILGEVLKMDSQLIFTAWEPYEYIISKLDKKKQFMMLLTGIGRL
jgi:very-short-patch-repair endonuclease